MLKVNFFHLCEKVIVEQGTGNLSIVGIFDNLNASNFPVTHPVMSIAVGFESDKSGTYEIELVFIDEKSEILKLPTKVNIGSNLKGNWVYKIVGYQIPRELTQKIKLNYDGQTIFTGYLTINNK